MTVGHIWKERSMSNSLQDFLGCLSIVPEGTSDREDASTQHRVRRLRAFQRDASSMRRTRCWATFTRPCRDSSRNVMSVIDFGGIFAGALMSHNLCATKGDCLSVVP